MLVTAVIPVHNHENWVFDAVESVASQDYRPLRIVVVDDGSTDNSTHAVLKHLYKPRQPEKQGEPWVAMGKLPQWDVDVMVQRFSQAHGPSFARNWGFRVGWDGTDLFAMLDSDDVYLPGKIARSVAKFQEAPDHIGIVYSDYDTVRPDGLRVRQYKEPFDRARLLQECIINCDSLISKKALNDCGVFDEQLRVAEDYDLWLRVTEQFMAVHLPEPLLLIRVGMHSSTSTVPSETWKQCYARVFQKVHERINANKRGHTSGGVRA